MKRCTQVKQVTICFVLLLLSDAPAAMAADNSPAGPAFSPRSQHRRPVAMAYADSGNLLCVANRDSGTISIIDTTNQQLIDEAAVGGLLSDLTALPDDRFLLATDEEGHRVQLLRLEPAGCSVAASIEVSPYPVSVEVSADGRRCFVASLWSREVNIIAIETNSADDMDRSLKSMKSVPLPFSPRKQLLVAADSKLLVADSFGGRLAVIDTTSGEIESTRNLPGHNIRGLALNAEKTGIYLSHQVLNPLARAFLGDVHWGHLLTNNVRVLDLETVLNPHADLLEKSRQFQVGDVGIGGGDPAELLTLYRNDFIVAVAGVDEVRFFTTPFLRIKRVSVGRRPTALLMSSDRQRIYVANTLGDSVSVIDCAKNAVTAEISLGPRPERSLAELGESLFYDARLSHDRWMSCHSCHTDGHTNGLLNDNLSDGTFDSPKRVLSLLGVSDTHPWAWNGQVSTLEEQIRNSTESTMSGDPLPDDQVAQLAAYLQTLKPAPPLPIVRKTLDDAAVARGQQVFQSQGCVHCHVPPSYTSQQMYDVGLTKGKSEDRKFNPPSIRGCSQRDAFFHDNSAHSLEEVVRRHQPLGSQLLSAEAQRDLIKFLESL